MIVMKEALSDARFAEKELLAQLERDFGAHLDAMSNEDLREWCKDHKGLEFGLKHLDRKSPLLRPVLLKLIARLSPSG